MTRRWPDLRAAIDVLYTYSLSPTRPMKLKEIHRTSTFAWSPSPELPLLATGTVAGALDESFSNNGQLEIWAPDFLDRNQFDLGGEGQAGPKAHVTTTSRCVRFCGARESAKCEHMRADSTAWHGGM